MAFRTRKVFETFVTRPPAAYSSALPWRRVQPQSRACASNFKINARRRRKLLAIVLVWGLTISRCCSLVWHSPKEGTSCSPCALTRLLTASCQFLWAIEIAHCCRSNLPFFQQVSHLTIQEKDRNITQWLTRAVDKLMSCWSFSLTAMSTIVNKWPRSFPEKNAGAQFNKRDIAQVTQWNNRDLLRKENSLGQEATSAKHVIIQSFPAPWTLYFNR